MKILTGKTIQEADRYTIEHEPISSLDLMERASETLAQWISNHIAQESVLLFVVGKGNNGGDGLAVARMLHGARFDCRVALIFEPEQLSEQCRQNLERLPAEIPVSQGLDFDIDPEVVIVDAYWVQVSEARCEEWSLRPSNGSMNLDAALFRLIFLLEC